MTTPTSPTPTSLTSPHRERTVTPAHRSEREQRTRWLTDARERQLDRDLANLPDLLAMVEMTPTGVRRPGEATRRTPPGSRPPVSLDAAALTDRRLRQDTRDLIGMSDLERMSGERRDGIEPTLRSWAILAEGEMLDDDADVHPIEHDQGVAADAAWLARHIVWIREQQWVVEFAGVVRSMVRDCERHLRIRPEYHPRCVAQGCRGRLDQHQGWWSCPRCGRDYRDSRMLMSTQQSMTAEEIGTAFGIEPATIRKWRERGHLQPVEDERRPRYHVLDVLRLADQRGVTGSG